MLEYPVIQRTCRSQAVYGRLNKVKVRIKLSVFSEISEIKFKKLSKFYIVVFLLLLDKGEHLLKTVILFKKQSISYQKMRPIYCLGGLGLRADIKFNWGRL